MFQTLKNAWSVPDIRKKILIVLALIFVFRIGSFIPVPGMNVEALNEFIQNSGAAGFAGMFNIISGGAFSNFAIFAMSITPYINASIILQLLTIAIPALERMSKEGEEGRKKIAQYTRYLTIVLALVQAIGLSISFRSFLYNNDFITHLTVVVTLAAGTAFIMWLSEQMNEYGIGNGTSLIIFAGIVSGLPAGIQTLITATGVGQSVYGILWMILAVVGMLALVAAVVWVTQAERRIPVQYAKRVVGRKMYGGQSTHIPMKVASAGVIPIILAMSLMMFPAMIIGVFNQNPTGVLYVISKISSPVGASGWYTVVHGIIYSLLIVGFTFFYTAITFNTVEIANNLKKNGGFIPGIRAGKPTAEYLNKISNKLNVFGSIFLAVVALIPILLQTLTSTSIYFGGTAILIVVGVAIETTKQLESQLVMRHYKGFLD